MSWGQRDLTLRKFCPALDASANQLLKGWICNACYHHSRWIIYSYFALPIFYVRKQFIMPFFSMNSSYWIYTCMCLYVYIWIYTHTHKIYVYDVKISLHIKTICSRSSYQSDGQHINLILKNAHTQTCVGTTISFKI